MKFLVMFLTDSLHISEGCVWSCTLLPWADYERDTTGKADSRAHVRRPLQTDRVMFRWRLKMEPFLKV